MNSLSAVCRAVAMAALASPLHAEEATAPAKQGPGTRAMTERLKALASTPGNSPFANVERAATLKRQMESEPNSRKQDELRYRFAKELLLAGDSREALAELTKLDDPVPGGFSRFHPDDRGQARMLLALTWLRIGEQSNCLAHHNAESCLLPLRGDGLHKDTEGSRQAAAILEGHLRIFPDDLTARWLLNVAHMTLGQYPDKVPATHLVPPKALESGFPLQPFKEIASSLGVNVAGLGGGAIAEDFDGDGYTDLMCAHFDLKSQVQFFRNNADGTFSDRTEASGIRGITGGINMLTTDYNNDGHPDVLILRGGWLRADGHLPKSLLRNNGDGTFEDVAEEAGLLSLHPTQTGAWFDYDGDGWLDLFIGNESSVDDANPCQLFHNNRDGTFTDCAKACGLTVDRYVKGVTAGDYNNDGRTDLYVSCLDSMNLLFRNDGPAAASGAWTFTNVTAAAGVREPKASFPTWFWDFDNDGWLDIFVSGYPKNEPGVVVADYLGEVHFGECARLYRNRQDGTFEDATRDAGLFRPLLSMGVNYGDLDNDGWLDFYIGTGTPDYAALTPNRMFRNDGGKSFQDVTSAARTGHLQKGHGIAFADLDHDGDQDIYQSMGGAFAGDIAFNTLYENPGGPHRWISLKLEGTKSNRAAIGARIEVVVETPKGTRSIFKSVSTGGSFGCSPLRQEIGLGEAKSIREVRIKWPAGGEVQVLKGVEPDRIYRVREGDAKAVAWPLKKFRLGRAKP